MLKFSEPMTTLIRIQKKTRGRDENGRPTEEWADLVDADIPCSWKNKFGNDVYVAAANNAKDPATIKLWYMPGITSDCRIVRVEDGGVFEIVGTPDDVSNRHQQLVIEVKRYIKG